jgi:uncharacterized protein (TIGR02300 family)
VAKAEWGVKRVCPSCNTRYYDMRKNPPVCPNCGTSFDPEALLKSRRRAAPEEKVKKPVEVAVVPEDAVEIDPAAEGETEEAVIEDAAELGDEGSELEEVVEIEEEK